MFVLCVVFILCGMFESFAILFSIIMVHEFGHYIVASLFGWEVEKVSLYLYGGLTVFKTALNKPLYQEFLVLIAGPIMQLLFYFIILKCNIDTKSFVIFESIHWSLLFFNLLPIYPLDGGKFVNIVLSMFLSYQKALRVTLYFSFLIVVIFLIFMFCNYISLNILFIIGLLCFKIISEWRRVRFYLNKFMLERYLYDYRFNKYIKINSIFDMRRDKNHFIYLKHKYFTEKALLKEKFNKRY